MILNLSDLINLDTPPSPYLSGAPLWTDPYIAQGMLSAHLSPATDAASYRPEKIRAICEHLARKLPITAGAELVDLGCGPGLYCVELNRRGYHLTGIDQSENSIQYARAHSSEPSITYRLGSYLEPFGQQSFDAALLIYEDFGVLAPEIRSRLLANIHQALRPGGWFVLDVASRQAFTLRHQNSHAGWYGADAGFWRPHRHFVFEKAFCFEDPYAESGDRGFSSDHQTIISNPAICDFYGILDDTLSCYRIWQTYFSPESIRQELANSGFAVRDLYSDLTGTAYDEESPVIGLICQKVDQAKDIEWTTPSSTIDRSLHD